jgi:hypothetical protein
MNTRNHILSLLLASSLGLSAAGCAGGGVGVGVAIDVPLPPTRAEVVLSRPGPAFVRIQGYWDWIPAARNWVWVEGRWERPPHRRGRWVPPRYDHRGRHMVYRRGHWRG